MDKITYRKPKGRTFVTDVLDRYQAVAAKKPGEEQFFKFYQMDISSP